MMDHHDVLRMSVGPRYEGYFRDTIICQGEKNHHAGAGETKGSPKPSMMTRPIFGLRIMNVGLAIK